MSNKRKRRRKKKKVEEPPKPVIIEEPIEEDDEEEEGEEEPEIVIPLVWRLADENDSQAILKLIQDAENVDNSKKKSGEEDGEGEDQEEEEAEEEAGEEGELEYDDNGDPIPRKKKKDTGGMGADEPLMSLDELLTTTHPEHEYNLLQWAIHLRQPLIIRKLISFMNREPRIFGFSNPKCIRIVQSWVKELETLNKLQLENAKKIQQEPDSEGEESENEEEGEERPDFFETTSHGEKMSVPELQSLCELGLYEGSMNTLKTRHGFARSIYPNGDVYLGTFKDHQKHGFGVYVYGQGGYYIGHFFRDLKDTFYGYMSYPDGSFYQGSFSQDLRKGYGRFRYVGGDFYYGQWANDKKEGYGIYEFHRDGSFYDGMWRQGKFVSGLWQMKNGMAYHGEYEAGSGQPFGMGVYYHPKKGVKQVGKYRKKKIATIERKDEEQEEQEQEGEEVDILITRNLSSKFEWVVYSNENMTADDFQFLSTKKKDRMMFVLVTGRSEMGKEKLLQGVEDVMKRHPGLFFLKRVTTRPSFGTNERHCDTINRREFEEIRNQGGFYFDWTAGGYGFALPQETVGGLKNLRGTKIVFLKVECLSKEFVERLKNDFQSDCREAREIKIIKVVCKNEVLEKRLSKRGLSTVEIKDVLDRNQKMEEIEKSEGIEDEMIEINNSSSLAKSVKEFVRVISKFDKN